MRKRKPAYRFTDVKSILVKRVDRIGDAIVTLPFLLELAKYFEVTILTSKYNDQILNKFLPTEVFTNTPSDFFSNIKHFVKNTFFSRKNIKNNVFKYDIFLDLNGVRDLDVFLRVKESNICKYYAGFNMGVWNLLLDYALTSYPVLFSNEHILDSCRKLAKEALGADIDIPDHIGFEDKITKPEDFTVKEPYVLVNISGFDKFRGPSPQMYAELLNNLQFGGNIVIMDELSHPNLEEFRRYIRRDNTYYLTKDYSLWELLYISQKSFLYVGSDSGITNVLQIPTNCLIFFATGLPAVWKPYSKKYYQTKKTGNFVIEETKNSIGLIKKIIYCPAWCRPCFDIGCTGRKCIRELKSGIDVISRELQSMLNSNNLN